jgi:chemotaxis protein MotA
MNISSLISFIAAFGVLAFGLLSSSKDPLVFIDGTSAFIVIGGTVTAAAISFRIEKLGTLLKIFFIRVMKGKATDYGDTIASLIKISQVYSQDKDKAKKIASDSNTPFLVEAMELANDNFLSKNELVKVLRSRVESLYQHYVADANKFKTLGKFPPAFGMMGTTIGMIVLLSNLGGADALKTIGPSMAICLITTLYGVAISNLIIIPIAENLTVATKEIKLRNTIITEGIRMILEGKNEVVLAEELNSFLLPNERVNWKEVVK